LWLHSLKVAQLLRSAACLHTNQSRSYLNHLVQRTWNMKCKIKPVITGATDIVTNGLRKCLETMPGKHSVHSLQKAAILETSHVIRKVLQCETGNLSGEDSRSFKRRSAREKRSATRHNSNNNNNTIMIIIFSRSC